MAAKIAAAALFLAAFLSGCAIAPGNRGRVVTPEKVDAQKAAALLSAYRRANGLPGLRVDPILSVAAERQAIAMARADKLSHTVAGTLEQRLAAVRLYPSAADENVSGGYFSLPGALEGWKKSPPHNANLLDPNMRRMGIGSAYAAQSKYHQYWSLILAH